MSKPDQQKTVDIILDGKTCQAVIGESVIQVADRHGIYIPRFCYHKQLSVVANCRMCLVEVKGAPKTLPACATVVQEGMEVNTQSRLTRQSQRAVMEFLLINHPLDCPICDQGGECELQDLAMGFGQGVSRFTEGKRSVQDEDLGPLVATHMTRCIHCTRCVRFGKELAGTTTLGELDRGESMAIGTYLKKGMHSELSANVMDVCPVGALTSKPFAYRGRSWGFKQNPSIATHDCLGSATFVQTLAKGYQNQHTVMRVLPRQDDQVNQVWLSDRDRFSYLAMDSQQRLKQPMIKSNDQWRSVSWQEALALVANQLQDVTAADPDQLAVLISHSASMQDGYAWKMLCQHLACEHLDHRYTMGPLPKGFSLQGEVILKGPISDLGQAKVCMMLGSYIRHEQPMAGYWIRQAVLSGGQAFSVNPIDYDWHMPVTCKRLLHADDYMHHWLGCLKYLSEQYHKTLPVSYTRMIERLNIYVDDVGKLFVDAWMRAGDRAYVLLGAYAQSLSCWVHLWKACRLFVALAGNGQAVNMLPGANGAGLHLLGCLPGLGREPTQVETYQCAYNMLGIPKKLVLLHQIEPEFDCFNSSKALATLLKAESVVCFSSFVSDVMMSYADVLLPVALPDECEGHYMNISGRLAHKKACVQPSGLSLPAWQVVSTIAHQLKCDELLAADFDKLTEAIKGVELPVSPIARRLTWQPGVSDIPLVRLGDPWIYGIDAQVRRSEPLQAMASLLKADKVRAHTQTLAQYHWKDGQRVQLSQLDKTLWVEVIADDAVHPGALCLPSGFIWSTGLGDRVGAIESIEES
ncbi:MAG: NADH-quinone oxidoreductase subunit NuoG [Pseudomonadota bacterium]|nr:NADH-quinone oxidoreductase subunit NuoG [Pseudomonadota bacterium]